MNTFHRKHQGSSGFTLVEVIVATGLTLLLFFGAISVYVAATRLTLVSGAACYASTDAANAVQHAVRDAEEANWICLPGEPGWTPPSNAPTAAFETSDQGGLLFTGVEVVFPATAAVTVQDMAGGTLSVSPTPYDRRQIPGAARELWIYRADTDGTPDAASGTALWMVGTEKAQMVNKALTTSLSALTVNAVQFSRPLTVSNAPRFLPYQLQIKLVTQSYSSVSQTQTSELTTGSQEALVIGKCVLMRDHELNNDHEPMSTPAYGAANAPAWRSD